MSPSEQTSVIITVNPRDLAFLHSTIESHEGLATLTTVDGAKGKARLLFFRHFAEDIYGLLHALEKTIDLRIQQEACEGQHTKLTEKVVSHA